MENSFVIDKEYVFYACGDGVCDKVPLHVQYGHEQAKMYGKYFTENYPEDDEIDIRFDIKDRLDDVLALQFAVSLFQNWKEEQEYEEEEFVNEDEDEDEDKDEEEEKEELEVEDFYDRGWEILSETYYYYRWDPEFIKDCMAYYSLL